MGLSRRVSVAGFVAVATAIAACASTYGEDAAPEVVIPVRDDGGAEDVALEAAAPDAGADAELATNCPTSRAPSCTLDQCERRNLYAPPSQVKAYPWHIVTDAANVYWVEQVVEDGGTTEAYNGKARGRVLRVSKKGGPVSELAAGYTEAKALVLDGPYVYWAQSTSTDTTIFRLRRDCTAPCGTPEPVATVPHADHTELVRGGAGILFVMTGDGESYRVSLEATSTQSAVVEKNAVAVGPFAWLTATDEAAFVTGRFYGGVARVTSAGKVTPFYVSAPDGGFVGLATDCSDLWTHGLETAPPVQMTRLPAAGSPIVGAAIPTRLYYDMKVDASFVYLAAANQGGVYAYEKKSGTTVTVYEGNVFSVAVDADGIYWGEHSGSGTLHMLVK